jgi:hypothetical protein
VTESPRAPQQPDRVVIWFLPLACAVYAVLAGRDANWDLLNYHYYNVHAWLTGRDQDLAVAQLQTWFNPLLHLPLYLGMEHLPPRLYAALLGAAQGFNLVLVWLLARRLWPARETLPTSGPLLVAATAGLGAGFLTQIGTSFGDTLISLPIVGAACLLLDDRDATWPRGWIIATAGLLGGIAVGLKPLAGIYALALGAMVAVLPGPIALRASRLGWMAAGGVAGVAVTGGWWYWHIAQSTGNPLFPYYNDMFESPLYWHERFTFTYFLPKTVLEAIFYPWIWLADSTRVSEMRFLDLTMPALMTLGVCGGLARALGLRPLGQTTPRPALRALAAFWVVGYVLWLTQSSVYRFAVVLEMTAPLLIVAWLSRWVPPRQLGMRIVAVLVPIMVITWPANFGRYAFAGRYVATSPIELAPGTMVVVAGWAPLSYMVGSFPATTPLVRIQSNMHGFGDRPNGMDAEARRRVDDHQGPLQLLVAEPEWSIAQPVLDHYRYTVDRGACRFVDGSLAGGGGAGRLSLCPLIVAPDR